MASTNINIRMDSDLKMQFEAFCSDMGRKRCGSIGFPLRLAVKCLML